MHHVLQLQAPAFMAGNAISVTSMVAYSASSTSSLPLSSTAQVVSGLEASCSRILKNRLKKPMLPPLQNVSHASRNVRLRWFCNIL